jgi:hypothetical protein
VGFQTPLHGLGKYLEWTTTGRLQLPDFQREYKWDDERVRSLLVTILRGHPLGVVMLLKTGNAQIRFKPRVVEQVPTPASPPEPDLLLLDGQQRLTSLTQALTGTGVVNTKDTRGKLMDRRYYVHMETALLGEDRIDDAVVSLPGDGVRRSGFGKVVELDLSDEDKERSEGYFPARLLCSGDALGWLLALGDAGLAKRFNEAILKPLGSYTIPAIELDESTTKAAVATVFEKVNTGGLPLNVFELLTATFAGDRAYYLKHGTDFRLNDDWQKTAKIFADHPVLTTVRNTDFLQAVTLLTTSKRNLADRSAKPPAVSAKREDILKLTLDDYLEWVDPLRKAFVWISTFLADLHIFDARSVPYPTQLVPLAALRVVMGDDIDLHGVRQRIVQWFWCGVLGELYGGAIETRFVRDVEQVPDWALGKPDATVPRTVQDANFVESRLHSLRTRNAAAYKGIQALILGNGARDWRYAHELDKVQYVALAVDIHHIFPQKWCADNDIDGERRESIVNKTPLSAKTNRIIGGVAPVKYLAKIEQDAKIDAESLDALVRTHLADPQAMRATDFDSFFTRRREQLVRLVEQAMGKAVQRDVATGDPQETPEFFDAADVAVIPDEEVDGDGFEP